MGIDITIAIPTHNRADLLAQTLASLREVQIPNGASAECIVVDNASKDATPDVVANAANELSFDLRRVRERRLGSSFARNRAISEARGEFICFIDDDVIVEPRWLVELIGAIERRQLDAACGLVIPRFLAEPPPWLGSRLWVKLAVHDRAAIERMAPREVEALHNYFSANVGFRKQAFDLFGNFREDLGVVGGNPISGEDTELFARILARGGAVGFAPRSRVHHLVGPERMTARYLRRKSFAFGVGSAVTGGRTHNRIDKLVKNVVRMGLATMRGDRESAIYHQLEIWNYMGYWRGRLLEARKANPLVNNPASRAR
jgi:glycosyltransferase involved in cell wall biosynthesis